MNFSRLLSILIILISFNSSACDTSPIITASNPVDIGGGFFTFDLQVCIGSSGSQSGFDVTMNCGLNITATNAATLTNAGKVANASIAGGVLTYTYPGAPGTWWEVDDGISGPCFALTLTVDGNPENCIATVTGVNDGCLIIASSWSSTIPGPCIVDFTIGAPGVVTSTTTGAGNTCNLRSSEDVIIQVDIPCPETYTFALCGGSTWDTYLYLGSSCCGGTISQNDDGCGVQSTITAALAAGTYFITVEGFSSGSGPFTLNVTVGTPCFILPVELTSFDGEHIEDKRLNRLTWQTSSEHNNDYFEVLKSYDGVNFHVVETIGGAGNSTSVNNYSHDDENLNFETIYYKLKQVDFNGEFEYSKIIALDRSTEDDYFVSEIFPNPTAKSFKVRTQSKVDLTTLSLEIVSMDGKLMYSEMLTPTKAMMTNEIDITNLNNGIYLVKISNGTHVKTQKLIVN